MVTTGLLVQRLQQDPELAGVDAVIIDECHERHLDSDLALAFCVDVRANLRSDLMLVATSATADADRVAAALGTSGEAAPIVVARAQQHPVETMWAPPARPIPLLADARVDPRLLDHVATVVDRALVESSGDVLVFLPGESEIRAVSRRIAGRVEVLELFGRQSGAEQDRALQPGSVRRVVLATDVAESSLTVPGVAVVVDAGLSREPRTDHARGLSTLITTKVSRSSAEQRAGRAGRTGPGRVYRCWSEIDHSHLADHAAPEIAIADLAGFALAVSRWGHPRGVGLALMDAPPTAALDVAEQTLQALDAIDETGRITARGRAIALVGTHPRLGCALIDGSSIIGADKAKQIVALLSDDTLVRRDEDDLTATWRRLRTGSDPAATGRWQEEMKRLGRTALSASRHSKPTSDDLAAGVIVGLAFPERLARCRSANAPNYLMSGGTGAQLDPGSGLCGSQWIAIATADRAAGRADARIRLAAVIDEATARHVGSALLNKAELIGWVDGDLRLSHVERLGAIVLSERPVTRPDPSEVAAAMREGLRAEGLEVLRWSKDSNQLRQRMWFCHRHLGPPWPEVSDDALLAQLDSWLAPELSSVRRRSDLERIDTGGALRRLLPWPEAARFDELAPERIETRSGNATGPAECVPSVPVSTNAESLFEQLEPLLTQVSKPIQYVGGELNARTKDWDSVAVRWALMYPDAYEVGLPNQGVQILYEVINERPDALAERTYSVWPDLERLLKLHRLPQFTVDGHRPVGAFDVLGISFSTELGYTNMLTALDLARIPMHADDRDDTHPIVLAGGHAAFNPEPIADFIDAAVLGDGEQVVGSITDVIAAFKAEGSPGGRDELLTRLAETGGVYVPRFYDVSYRDDGQIAAVVPNRERIPARVSKHTVMDLDEWPYPKTPLVPLAESVHERMSVEIFRGCTRGCRFCQAGMITRPVRERSIEGIGKMVENGLAATGFEEVGLLSLSSADHSEIGPLAKQLADRYEESRVSLSLPSTRVDAFNIDLANEFSRNGRRSGLTFAPEGGSERLRRVINKMVSHEDLINTVSAAYLHGWRQVKLYFMCGLPTETDEDVLEIATMAQDVIRAGRTATGSRDIKATVSIGGFVPKPHTPFQWAAQASPDTVDRRLKKLREAINSDRSLGRNIGMRYHDGEPSLIEGLLSRGDRRVGAVIEQVWRDGGRFDGWSEHFSYTRWVTAAAAVFADQPVSVDFFTTRERDADEVLPWDHLDSGLDKQWLWDDWQDALTGYEQDDCRWTPCFDCGVCPTMGTDIQVGPTGKTLLPLAVKR